MTGSAFDVAIIGGGIIGTAAAAFLARAGRSVVLLERDVIAAGASGRNSGALQRPFDPALGGLHQRSVELYRELAALDPDFRLGDEPAGLLLVTPDAGLARSAADELAHELPLLAPEYLAPEDVRRVEPGLADGIAACRLATGYPVVPAAATLAYARLAQEAGVDVRLATQARLATARGRVTGVMTADGVQLTAAQVLVAAGPWSPALVPGWQDWPPIRPTHGVVVATRLERPPTHILEELGYDPGRVRQQMFFSLVTADGMTSLGSTFFDEPPDANAVAPQLADRGARFVPGLAGAQRVAVRVCQRPVSYDGRPLLGAVGGVDGLYVCAGHGPWGISTGPASALVVTQLMQGTSDESAALAPELAADRLVN